VIVPKSGGAYEVAGSAAISFIPHDPKDLSEKSLERARIFTWQKAAKEYLNIYKKLANHN